MKCDICEKINNNLPEKIIILKYSKWEVVLDPNQQNLGKCWVTLLDHKSMLSELDDDDWAEFAKIVRKLELNCKIAFAPHHFNWQCLMNDADSKSQEPHIHWHFSPRYKNPINFNNEVFTDENYPRTNKNLRLAYQDTLMKIAEKLRG